MPARKRQPTSIQDTLPAAIPKIFDNVQNHKATHQKNFVALHKIFVEASAYNEELPDGLLCFDDFQRKMSTGDRLFAQIFMDMLNRVLVVKKGTSVADKVVQFVGGFVGYINKNAQDEDEDEDEDEEDVDPDKTPEARFTTFILRRLRKGFKSKDKTVRYRVLHFFSSIMSNIEDLTDYAQIRPALFDRAQDKEAPVRIQAVIALSKLTGSEVQEDLKVDPRKATEVLLDVLAQDPAADVRRVALSNVPIDKATLPVVLARTRDVDTTNRVMVYRQVLQPNIFLRGAEDETQMGATHPRVLSIAQRELIVRNGLGDREDTVRGATGRLLGDWVEAVGGGKKNNVAEDLLAFLSLFDLDGDTVAVDALNSVFKMRVEFFDGLEFDEHYWVDMTAEKAFLIRVWVEYCKSTNEDVRFENVLPVVTALAFHIQTAYNGLLSQNAADEEDLNLRGDIDGEERVRKDDARQEKEFIIDEMLKLAAIHDYGDEIGRRKMFQLVRDMISQDALPERLVSRCLDVLRELTPSERDLIRVVVEVVHELRDSTEEEEEVLKAVGDDTESTFEGSVPPQPHQPLGAPKPVKEMTQEEREHADVIDLRCLDLCIGMLERVNGTFEENSTLEGILGELIIPAVKRKEMVLREKGLVSLGLCCLIARRMAISSFQLFMSQVQSAPEPLKIRVLHVIFDVLMVHDAHFLGKNSPNANQIIAFLLQVLEMDESDKVQALVCVGFAKLMLSGMVVSDDVLGALICTYISPETIDNQELRQCLSYFFPVYCYSSPVNQRRMMLNFIPIFKRLAPAYNDLEEDQEMVSPLLVCGMFVDWTDPQKTPDIEGLHPDYEIHLDMALAVIKEVLDKNSELDKEHKKVLCQILGKLYLPAEGDDDKLRTVKLYTHYLTSKRPVRDTTANKAAVKFDETLSKKYEKVLEDFSEEVYRQLEALQATFEELDDLIPLDDDDEEIEMPKKRAGRKRRSASVTTDASSTADEGPSTPKPRGKGRAKRRRTSQSDDDDEDDEVMRRSPPTSTVPTRSLPRRAATKKVDMTPIVLEEEEDDDDDDDEEVETTPVPPSRKPTAANKNTRKPREASAAEDSDEVIEIPQDSIMDSDDDEDEEVDDLL